MKKFERKKAFHTIIFITIITILFIILTSKTTESEKNSPPPNGGYSRGNWVIENGDNITRVNQEIRLEGNLQIENGGKLTFKNVTLIMSCNGSSPLYAELKIGIESGGEFYVFDYDNNSETKQDFSLISMGSTEKKHRNGGVIPIIGYSFYVNSGGKLEMRNSILYECGYYFDLLNKNAGLQIESDNVILDHNLIEGNFYGIICIRSSPIITNNTISSSTHDGILCQDASPTLQNNVLENNTYGLNLPYDSKETIPKMSNNFVNGICIEGSYHYKKSNVIVEDWFFDSGHSLGYYGNISPQGIITLYDCPDVKFSNCDISYNGKGILAHNSNATLINCTISKTYDGVYAEYSNLTILNSKILNNNFGFSLKNSESYVKTSVITKNNVGFYIKYSDPIIENCTISDNKWEGIYSYKSNPIIKNNTISKNGKRGIACYVSSPFIINNNIVDHKEGIYSHNSTATIEENEIYENHNGIYCDLGTIDIKNNEIYNNTNAIYTNYSEPKITNNKILNNKYGILSYSFSETKIKENLFLNNTYAIYSNTSSKFNIIDNEITKNNYGIYLTETSTVNLKNNKFADNQVKGIYIGEYAFTNWEINNYAEVRNDTLSIRGDIVIIGGGNLELSNATILIHSSSYAYSIEVLNGGSIYISNSTNITTHKPTRKFNFRVQNGAKMVMKNSELHNCGDSEFYSGLIIESDDVILEKNIITNNYYGIYCFRSSPIIKNNYISKNKKYGIYCFYSNATIIENTILKNYNGIMISSSRPSFRNNQIKENQKNGIILYGKDSKTKIINCTITDNRIGIYADYDATPTLINCTVSNDFYLDRNSEIITINSIFNKADFGDSNSTILVNWFLHLKIIYPNGDEVENANIHIQEQDFDKKYITDSNGLKKWILLSEYSKNYEKIFYYTYSINISKGKIYNVSKHNIENTKSKTFVLEDIVIPEIFEVNVSEIKEDSAFISWNTNEKCDSKVVYGKNTNYELEEYDSNFVYNHFVLLKNLESDTNYSFTIISKDETGNSNSYVGFFKTLEDKTAPNPIKNLRAQDTKKGGEIKLTWDESNASDFSRYNIYRIDEDIKILLGISTVKKETTYFVNNLTNNKIYYFAVTAQDKKGNENKTVDIVKVIPTLSEFEIKIIAKTIGVEFPNNAQVGEEIKIIAIIENIGNVTIEDLVVEFYFGEKLIGKKKLSKSLEVGRNTKVNCYWNAEKGKEKIKIILKNPKNDEIVGEVYESEDWLEVEGDELSESVLVLLVVFILIIVGIIGFGVSRRKRSKKKKVRNKKEEFDK